MSESSSVRTARALDLVPFLLEHQGISVEELATEFGVSTIQILEDLNLLFVCGLPGYSPLELIDMNFEDGYVTVSEPQVLDKPRKLSRPELTTLLVSLEVMKSLAKPEVHDELSKLQSKLQSALSIKPTIDVVVNSTADPKLEEISHALDKGIALDIRYLSAHSDKESWRLIIPNRIYVEGQNTFVQAWCESSKGERVFRLDRILELTRNEGAFVPGLNRELNGELNGEDVGYVDGFTLLVSPGARIFLEENAQIVSHQKEVPGGVEVEIAPIDPTWLVRTIAGFGAQVSVLNPPSLKAELANHLEAIKLLYT